MNFITIQKCIILTCRNNICPNAYKRFSSTLISFNEVLTHRLTITKSHLQLNCNGLLATSAVQFCTEKLLDDSKKLKYKTENSYSAVQFKKRPKKRKSLSTDKGNTESWNVKALATSEEYNLEALVQGLIQQQLYVPNNIITSSSCK